MFWPSLVHVDIGVTQHMSHGCNSLKTYEKWEDGQVIYLGDNTTHQIYGQRNVFIKLNSCRIKDIFNVLHVLALRNDYFFKKQLDQVGGKNNN